MKSFAFKSILSIALLALGTPIAIAASGTIGPGFTGAWFDPAQSGHGLFIEILPDNRIQAAWFTFNPAGEQAWFLGVGSYVDNSATISAVEPVGGRWIPNFDPRQIVDHAWGTLTLTFTDADHGRVDFSSALGFGAGSMNLARLTKVAAANVTDPSIAAKWVAASPLSVARSWHHATLLRDGRVLVTGGGNPTAELYDPVTDTWRRSANMSANFEVGAATLLRNGKVLIVGDPHSELYDPVSDTWTATGNANEFGHTATLLDDGRVLVTRGFLDDGWGDLPVVYGELYDPATGQWTRTGPLSDPGTTATLLYNGKVLVTGGLSSQIYDPPTDTWASVGGPNFASAPAAVTLADGSVMVVGQEAVEVFDPVTSAWARIADLNIPRGYATATLLPDGNVLVVGGWSCSADACILVATTELYDVHARQWRFAGDLIQARAFHAATLLRDGRVLIEGGEAMVPARKSLIGLASAELYPAPVTIGAGFTGSWYDPAQSGHGLFVEVLPDNAFLAAWFTFNPAGTEQSWFLGVGTYSGDTATVTSVLQPTGGRWIPNFDPTRIANNPWGTLTFTFADCNHGKVEFASSVGYGAGSMNLTRLTQPAGLTCP